MISDDKSDPHSGSDSSGSDEMSQHSSSVISTSASFSTSNQGRRNLVTSSSGEVPTGVVSLSGSDGFGQDDHANSVRNHHFAHYSASSHNSGFFPNGGHLGPGGLHMMTSGGYHGGQISGGHHETSGGGGGGGEANRKRVVRLQKNREAARECRRKKKEYIKCLENRVAVLENQNKALIEELKSLKELYAGKSYGSSEVPKIEIL
jgi:hypothetical protein